MDTSTIVGALLVIAVVALVALSYAGRIELSAELPFIRFAVKGESKSSATADASTGSRTSHRSEQIQTDAVRSSQEMPAKSGGKQVQRRTRDSNQKMT